MRHTDSRQARSSVLLLIPSSSYRANDFMDAASRLDVEVLVGIDKEPALSPSESSMVTLDFDDPDRAAERPKRYGQVPAVPDRVSGARRR